MSLRTAKKNPMMATTTPIACVLSNFSLKNIYARITMTMTSNGPARRTSFDAPTLLMESYQVSIPIARNTDAQKRFLLDFENIKTPLEIPVVILFLL